MQNSLFHRTLGIGAFSRAARVRVTARTAAPWDGGYGTICEKLCASVSTSRESYLSREAGGVSFIEKPSGDPTMGVAARDKLSRLFPRRVSSSRDASITRLPPEGGNQREPTPPHLGYHRRSRPANGNDDLARHLAARDLSLDNTRSARRAMARIRARTDR